MRIIPVLDWMAGSVVHAIRGRRSEYRPLRSTLTDSCQPLDVALALRRAYGFTDLYLADLDAIEGKPPAVDVYRALGANGFRLWVDAGLRRASMARPFLEAGVANLIAGLESLAGPGELAELCRAHGERVIFSLDLRGGQPLGDRTAWEWGDAVEVVDLAVAAGARRVIVLDLGQVGSEEGPSTGPLCRHLLARHPGLEVLTGGGVRAVGDLDVLREAGVTAVLVSSALHNGRLTPEDVRCEQDGGG